MPQDYDDVIINIALEEPSRSSPALGQIDKLLRQSALETQSLQVVRRMVMRDMLDRAQVTGVSKLTAAAKKRQALLPGLVAENENGHMASDDLDDAPTKKKRKKRVKNQTSEERRNAIRQFLEAHPGADTHTMAKALGWLPNLVLRYANDVATHSVKTGDRRPVQWYLKGTKNPPASPAPSSPAPHGRVIRKSRETRQAEIRKFLSKKPEAFTVEIAKALGLQPNSTFKKVLTSVARPARPTKGTQPIQWVLT